MTRGALLVRGLAAGFLWVVCLAPVAQAQRGPTPVDPALSPLGARIAPDVAPSPRARPATEIAAVVAAPPASPGRSPDDIGGPARDLAREAARAYSLALAAPADAQAEKFAEALALFDRIAREHPESAVARDGADGRIGMIDIDALRALVAAEAEGQRRPTEPDARGAVAQARAHSVAAARASASLCGRAESECATALGAAATGWLASPGVVAALSDLARDATAAERLATFRGLLASAEFAAFEASSVHAAPLAALVALDALGSSRGAVAPVVGVVDATDESARRAARLWSVSAVSLALLGDDLVAEGVSAGIVDALVARAFRLDAALYESLARGLAAPSLLGGDGERRLSAAEQRFLGDVLALTSDMHASLIAASRHAGPAERASALEEWVHATQLAVSPWRTALTDHPVQIGSDPRARP